MTGTAGGVILYDGVCILCSRLARFVIARDRAGFFRFVPVQGDKGQTLCRTMDIDPEDPASFVVIVDGIASFKSDAALAVLSRLPGWRWTHVFRVIPASLRDRLYDAVARRRYRLFGRTDHCILPDAAIRSRFEGLPDSHGKPPS